MAAKLPSVGVRRGRIRENLSKLDRKRRANLPLSQRRSSKFASRRSQEMDPRVQARPQDRIKKR